MNMKEKLESLGKNSIVLKIAKKEKYKLGASRSGSHLARRARGLPFFSVFSLGFSNHSSSLSFRPVKASISRWAISQWVNTPQFQEPISHVCIESPTLLPGAGGP